MDAQTAYHLPFRHPWIHIDKAVSSKYHQCVKSIWKGRLVHINATESPFQRNKAYFFEAQYFEESVEEGKVTIAQPQGVPLPT